MLGFWLRIDVSKEVGSARVRRGRVSRTLAPLAVTKHQRSQCWRCINCTALEETEEIHVYIFAWTRNGKVSTSTICVGVTFRRRSALSVTMVWGIGLLSRSLSLYWSSTFCMVFRISHEYVVITKLYPPRIRSYPFCLSMFEVYNNNIII